MARELLYKRAETEMRRRITEGDWAVGTRLGNEFELADEFQVSQGTMRRALMSLEADGLLSRKPGRGTIVAAVAAQGPAAAPAGQLRDADGAEAAFEIHRTKSTVRAAEGAEAEVFGETRLHHAERLLKFAGERAALEEIMLPIDLAPEFDDTASPNLTEALEGLGLTPAGVEDALSAELTSMGDSVALSCDRNTPLLCVTRIARDDSGRVLARQVLRVADPSITYA